MICALLVCLAATAGELRGPFYIDYSADVDERTLGLFEFSILAEETKADLSKHKAFGYLSVVEVAPGARHRDRVAQARIPILGQNAEWSSDLVDVTSPAWSELVLNDLAPALVKKGFKGFFLDTVESVEILAERNPARAEAFRASVVQLIKGLKKRFPEQPIVINRGFKIWEAVREDIAGVLVESMFQTYDFKARTNRPLAVSDTEWLLGHTRKIKAAGLDVLVADYCDRHDRAVARETARKIEELGYLGFVTTPELNGAALAPIREEPRRILALFGNQEPEAKDRIQWPIDSGCARMMAMPLEWLGFEIDYLNVNGGSLPRPLPAHYAAVLLDAFLVLPRNRESEFAGWLIEQRQAGRKILFAGGIPFTDENERTRILEAFGMSGSGEDVRPVSNLQAAQQSALMNFETKARLLASKFADLRAPLGAEIEMAVSGVDSSGKAVRFDAVFTADWGGAALNPYLFFRAPDFVNFWLVNPFEFFAKALKPAFPVPDHTTKNGRRIFFSHIDGDGFRHKSAVERGKTSAEVTMERVLKKYPLPITVSVIESEMRALVEDQKAEEAPSLVAIAREMFALPNVQAASHTYSHPFYWLAGGRTDHLYPERALKLRPPHAISDVDYEREVVGSINYINETLLPPGKKCELILWSGDCRPPPAALAAARKIGVENMNGGDANISRKHPTVTRVSGRGAPWDGEWQVYACGENENIYLDGSNLEEAGGSTLDGGFIHNIDAFQRMGSPRRLKPVNIYYHFYSADRPAPMNALTAVYDWSMQQPLIAVTATEYAKIARDCREAAVYEAGEENRWILLTGGQVTTFRIAANGLRPDLARSRGVLGYAHGENCLYVHTDGSARVELALAAKPAEQPHLESSSAALRFEKLDETGAEFFAKDYRPIEVVFGGARGKLSVRVNNEAVDAKADANGRVTLALPKEAKVSLTVEK